MPNFFLIGAHKSGTTSLYHYLGEHPNIYMSPEKEPRFFALSGKNLDYRGPSDPTKKCKTANLQEYQCLFKGVQNEKAIGESSTLYLYADDAAENIYKYDSTVKILSILRDPVERAYSNFMFARQTGHEILYDFMQALSAEESRILERWGPLWHYKRKGFYFQQLEKYFNLFHKDRIKIVLYDEFKENPLDTVQKIYQFLEVDESFIPDLSIHYRVTGLPNSNLGSQILDFFKSDYIDLVKHISRVIPQYTEIRKDLAQKPNVSTVSHLPKMSDASRLFLKNLYRQDILNLQELIGQDLSTWLSD
jgi:hypothetical protein